MTKRINVGDGLGLPNPITTGSLVDEFALTDPFYSLGGLRTVDYTNLDAIPDWDGTNIDYARNDRVESTVDY